MKRRVNAPDIKRRTRRLVAVEWGLFALCVGFVLLGEFDLWIVLVTGAAAILSLVIHITGPTRTTTETDQ